MADETEDTGMEFDGFDDSGNGEEPFWVDEEADLDEGGIGAACDTIADFLDSASVDRVFAEPVAQGETLVIPAAEVAAFLGFGVGSGHGPRPVTQGEADAPSAEETAEGSGGVGGGRTFARPVAVIVVAPDGVRVKPVVDSTKIVTAALATAGFMMAMLAVILAPRERG